MNEKFNNIQFGEKIEITLTNNKKVSGVYRKMNRYCLLLPSADAPQDEIIGAWDVYGEACNESDIKENVLQIKRK